MRQKKDCISLWHKTSSDTEACERVREGMRKVLNLPSHIQMEYRNHKDVLHWTRERDGKVRPGSPTHMMERERGSSLGPIEGNPRRDTGGAVGGAPGMPPPR
jgi:hypothetical protein